MQQEVQQKQWFALRDLKRSNAINPAYIQLPQLGFEVFTPLKTKIVSIAGKPQRKEVPFIQDLLFVFTSRDFLDPVINKTNTLQYMYVKGAPQGTPLTVRTNDMAKFIHAVTTLGSPRYYSPEEITPDMCRRRIRLHCNGPLDNLEGYLLTVKGSSKKRILVELAGLLTAAVEIQPQYIELI